MINEIYIYICSIYKSNMLGRNNSVVKGCF